MPIPIKLSHRVNSERLGYGVRLWLQPSMLVATSAAIAINAAQSRRAKQDDIF